jgi:uncharacterized iron-regulated membrane protein
MTTLTLRSAIVKTHKWVGLNVAIFFAVIFLSGSLLVVADEIRAVFHPKIWVAPIAKSEQASFGTIYDTVSRDFPQSTIYVLQRSNPPWLADRAFFTTGWGEKLVAWTDPGTGAVLDVTSANDFRIIIRKIHDSMVVPGRIGFVLVSATSFILLTSVISGLVNYRRFWKGLFRLPSRRSGAQGFQGGLHRLIGVWSALFLLLIALTGLFFLAGGLGITGFTPKPAPAAERAAMRPAGFDGALIEKAEQKAKDALFQFAPTTMVAPGRPSDGIKFAGFTGHTGPFSGPTTVTVDPLTLKILGKVGPSNLRGNARLKPVMEAIHFGGWSGQISRLLWLVFGLASSYLMLNAARVFVAREVGNGAATAKSGGIVRFIKGLGLFKWAYLAVILAVVALIVLRFGPPATKWVTIAPTTATSSPVKLRIFGGLRQGEPAQFRLSVDRAFDGKITVASDMIKASPVQFDTENQAGPMAFSAVGSASGNVITVVLSGKDSASERAVFNLGATLW